jgi:hypothetical protein
VKFNFTDKASYLAWRLQWKTLYVSLSQEIRTRKAARKQFINHYRHWDTPRGPVRMLSSREPNPLYDTTGDSRLSGLRAQAAYQMELLAEAKALSWSLKQASLPLGVALAKAI